MIHLFLALKYLITLGPIATSKACRCKVWWDCPLAFEWVDNNGHMPDALALLEKYAEARFGRWNPTHFEASGGKKQLAIRIITLLASSCIYALSQYIISSDGKMNAGSKACGQ